MRQVSVLIRKQQVEQKEIEYVDMFDEARKVRKLLIIVDVFSCGMQVASAARPNPFCRRPSLFRIAAAS
jgi:hypothetical protein